MKWWLRWDIEWNPLARLGRLEKRSLRKGKPDHEADRVEVVDLTNVGGAGWQPIWYPTPSHCRGGSCFGESGVIRFKRFSTRGKRKNQLQQEEWSVHRGGSS